MKCFKNSMNSVTHQQAKCWPLHHAILLNMFKHNVNLMVISRTHVHRWLFLNIYWQNSKRGSWNTNLWIFTQFNKVIWTNLFWTQNNKVIWTNLFWTQNYVKIVWDQILKIPQSRVIMPAFQFRQQKPEKNPKHK